MVSIAGTALAFLMASPGPASAAPSIDGEWASGVTESDATLNAEINPNGAPVSYFFEIDTVRSDNFTHPNCPFGPCASITVGPPLPPGLVEPPLEEIPAGAADVPVSVDMASLGATLQPGTTYFYRVVAHTNYSGPTEYGPELSFTTTAPFTTAASDPALETVEVPATVKPSYVMVDAHGQRDHPTIRGRTFTFRVYTGPKCIGVPPASLRRVRVVERPKTAARPFKSVVLTPYVEYPAHTETVDPASGVRHGPLCARDAMPSVRRRVRLKRPAADLIFFDGSTSPPRRIWPPPVG